MNDLSADTTIADLRRQLAEAEETLRAIREGDIDALVIQGEQDDEIFTLESGNSYRIFMEGIDLGVAALDRDHKLFYANRALSSLLGRPAADLHESGLFSAFSTAHSNRLRDLLNSASSGAASCEISVEINGETKLLLASANPVQLGAISGVAVAFTDLTQRARAEAAEEAQRAAQAIMASANEAVVVCDPQGIISHVNMAALAITGEEPVGKHFNEAIHLELPANTSTPFGYDVVGTALSGSSIQGVEAGVTGTQRIKDVLISAAPLNGPEGTIAGAVVTMVDLSERKAFERQQQLMMGELDHRVKNTLQLVLSICNHTATSETTIAGFQRAFVGRIRAMSAAHDLLAQRGWAKLSIASVINAELRPYVNEGAGRVTVKGLEIDVAPRAAIALGLIFHELVTNSVKYGALSSSAGRLSIALIEQENEETFGIEWIESGGPVISGAPTRTGFGQKIITRSLQYARGGGAKLQYLEKGLHCELNVPRIDLLG